jgi:2-polyprenyl-6-methoxyphenol hydroxylase-like FAD-dependent oxidoreductase
MTEQVLIVGAGPTGMVLALWLNKLGIKFRILDRASGPGTTSRAMAVQARTLELYQQLDLSEAVVKQGKLGMATNFWAAGVKKATVELGELGKGLTPYPYMLVFPQDRHEKLLAERLAAAGVTIERNIEVLSYQDLGTHISAVYREASGEQKTIDAQYIVGSDGAPSLVRKGMDVDFPGGTYDKIFYVADVEASGPVIDGNMHIDFEKSDFMLVMNYAQLGLARLIGTVKAADDVDLKTMRFEDVSQGAMKSLKIDVQKVNWFSVYRVHHRVASTFHKGRAFIAGDAGHIHSPAGGQGMNTGIGDAINLAWKLAAVLHGEATEALLETYNPERQTFATKLVHTTDKLFTLATAEGGFANFFRADVFPAIVPLAMGVNFTKSFLFHAISQIDLNYRESPISAGSAGKVQGGERLPWVSIDGRSNFDHLPLKWNVQVYGSAEPALIDGCKRKDLPLTTFAWRKEYDDAGFKENAMYLLRPDTYVAFASKDQAVEKLDQFFESKGLMPVECPA